MRTAKVLAEHYGLSLVFILFSEYRQTRIDVLRTEYIRTHLYGPMSNSE